MAENGETPKVLVEDVTLSKVWDEKACKEVPGWAGKALEKGLGRVFGRGGLVTGAFATALLVGCATPKAEQRAEAWRAILREEAPVGAPAAAADAALRRRGIETGRGVFVTQRDDGSRISVCPDSKAAVTGREVAGRVGFNSNVIEIIACLDSRGLIVSHDVGIWIQ